MTSSLASSQPAAESQAQPMRWRLAIRAIALTPLWVFLALFLTGNFYDPIFGKPPDIMGLPLGAVIAGLAGGWMLIGAAIAWDARSPRTVLFAVTIFTIPALFVLILGPAMILIIQNM
jgi:hypothetical protein